MKRSAPGKSQKGQTTVEYIMMLAVVTGIFVLVAEFFRESQFVANVMAPIRDSFRRAYQFGDVDVKGLDGEEPERHPRVTNGNNFRIFINPEQ